MHPARVVLTGQTNQACIENHPKKRRPCAHLLRQARSATVYGNSTLAAKAPARHVLRRSQTGFGAQGLPLAAVPRTVLLRRNRLRRTPGVGSHAYTRVHIRTERTTSLPTSYTCTRDHIRTGRTTRHPRALHCLTRRTSTSGSAPMSARHAEMSRSASKTIA